MPGMGSSEAIAAAALFLVSGESSFVNGAIIPAMRIAALIGLPVAVLIGSVMGWGHQP